MRSSISVDSSKSLFSKALLHLALALLLVPAGVAAQGLTWTVSPSARWIDWDKAFSFDDTRLLGGAMGIGFGRYVGLEAFHHEEDGVSLFTDVEGAPTVDVAQSGARVTLAFGTGKLVPIVGGGASLLRFRADGADRIRKLSLDYGAGLRIVLAERIQGEVSLEKTRYFLDSGNILDPTLPTSDEARENLTLRAGLGIQLGRRSFDRSADLDDSFAQRYQAPFSGFALAIEPLIGRLDFDGPTGLARQDMVGVRAGVDFGSFFGLRAFHWWGTEDDFRTTNGFRILGGEAQFNLAAGPGITPFLTGGAGQLHWTPRGNGINPAPADQTAVILGGGVDFNFGQSVRVSLSARDYILGSADLAADPDLGSVADPDELIHNWQYSAGLKFVLGGGGGLIRSAVPARTPRVEPTTAAADEPLEAPVLEPVVEAPGAPTTQPTVVTESATRATMVPAGEAIPRQMVGPGGRNIIIPVPESGELYVRFGEPQGVSALGRAIAGDSVAAGAAATGQLSAEQLRAIIREEFRRLSGDTVGARPDTAQANTIRRLEARVDSLTRVVRTQPAVAVPAAPAQPAAAPAQPVAVPATVVPGVIDPSAPIDRSLRETRFFTGFATTGPSQILLGLGTDIGPLSHSWNFINLVPSLAFGFGNSRPTYLAALSAEYRFGSLPVGSVGVQPMVSIGAGLFRGRDFEAIVPTFAGASFDVTGGNLRALDGLYFGLQGVDFMKGGRFLVGLRRLP